MATLFHASQFTPYATVYKTGHGTAKDKAKFANDLAEFIVNDFPATRFSNRLYSTLSNCFGHIAHYNQHGFFHTWFDCDRNKLEWLEHALRYSAPGDPAYCFTDVERAIQQFIRNHPELADAYRARIAAATEAAERAELTRLQEKYA